MKILATGAAGFTGAPLTMRLLARGDVAVGVDSHNNHFDPTPKDAQLARFINLRITPITVYDPVAMKETQKIYGQRDELRYAETPLDTLQDADALIIVTEGKTFKSSDFDAVKSRLKQHVIFDGQNLLEPIEITLHGLEYRGIGRDNLSAVVGMK
jgi:hypothetical protein